MLHYVQFDDGGSGLSGEAAAKDSQLAQRLAPGHGQQPPRMVEHRTQAAMTCGQLGGRVGQNVEILCDLAGDLATGQQPRPAGGYSIPSGKPATSWQIRTTSVGDKLQHSNAEGSRHASSSLLQTPISG